MPTIILDFDQTLFAVARLKAAQFKAVRPYLKIKQRAFWDRCAEAVIKKNGYYLPLQHLQAAIKKDRLSVAQQRYQQQIKNSQEFVYPDVFSFWQRHKDCRIILLTFGQKKFQTEKIKKCHLGKYDLYTTTELKYKKFSQILKKYPAPYYFIDDKGQEIDPVKRKFPQVICLWMRRPDGSHRREPCLKADFKITNLKINLKKYVLPR